MGMRQSETPHQTDARLDHEIERHVVSSVRLQEPRIPLQRVRIVREDSTLRPTVAAPMNHVHEIVDVPAHLVIGKEATGDREALLAEFGDRRSWDHMDFDCYLTRCGNRDQLILALKPYKIAL